MIKPGDVISYLDMCREEGVNLQRGMNFRLRSGLTVVLMSIRKGAPYADRVEDDGRVLIYEGHDVPSERGGPDPKKVDQLAHNPGGGLTQNGLFEEVALAHKRGETEADLVKVYEKLRPGIWVYNGVFQLLDAWRERSNDREVFKFKLQLTEDMSLSAYVPNETTIDHNRLIPTAVKLTVWKRDKGKCVKCSSTDNLHFDHIIPYSKGGSSLVAENVQLLCARHNIAKRDTLE